jgi:hypothetical protein
MLWYEDDQLKANEIGCALSRNGVYQALIQNFSRIQKQKKHKRKDNTKMNLKEIGC